jgi:hypothetical protein
MDAASQHPVLVSPAWHPGAGSGALASGCWFGRAGIRVLVNGRAGIRQLQTIWPMLIKDPVKKLHHDKQSHVVHWFKNRSQPKAKP